MDRSEQMDDTRLKQFVKGGAEACAREDVQFSDMSAKIKQLAGSTSIQSNQKNIYKGNKQKMEHKHLSLGQARLVAFAAIFIMTLVIGIGFRHLYGGIGNTTGIKALAEYNKVATNYRTASAAGNQTPASSILYVETKASSTPALKDFNFKVTSGLGIGETPVENIAEIIIDGVKGKVTSPMGVGYIDGFKEYFQHNDIWYYQVLDSLDTTASIFDAFYEFLNPALYNKTKNKDEHIYTFKNGAAFPTFSNMPHSAQVKINKDRLLLEIFATVPMGTGATETLWTYRYEFSLGGQTVTLPAGTAGAIEYVPTEVIPPDDFAAVAGNEEVTLSWSPATGGLVTGYGLLIINMSTIESESIESQIIELGSGTLTYTFTELENGTEYMFMLFVRHRNGSTGAGSITATPNAPK